MPLSDSSDVDAAVAAARSAHPAWGALSHSERADWLDRIADALEARYEDVAALESRDTGKPISLARDVDAQRSVSNFRFFAGMLREHEEEVFEMASATNYVVHKPVGVGALITPWNLPLYLLSWKVAPAIGMGNTVVCKPSELTPMTADLLMQVIDEVGLPAGVVNLVHGDGVGAGAPLVAHSDVDLVSFTGGTSTGEKVAASAAPAFKKLSLELGGKNASVVFADCDMESTVAGVVRAGFLNQGQVCLCGSRILEPHRQTWPWLRKPARTTPATVDSISQSAKTTLAFLPPSSRLSFLNAGAADAATFSPVDVPPVNETRSTSEWATSGAPAPTPSPCTRLTTPAGRPTSSMTCISRSAVIGVSSLGLHTTVLPMPMAGATFHESR